MATESTKKGYRLAFGGNPNGFVFQCFSRKVYWSKATSFRKGEDLVSSLQVIAPCTLSEIIAVLRAWLGAYADEELLAQVDAVATEIVNGLPDLPAPTPSAPPPERQGMN